MGPSTTCAHIFDSDGGFYDGVTVLDGAVIPALSGQLFQPKNPHEQTVARLGDLLG